VRTERTDAELIRAAESDPAAFGRLYERHVEAVHAWFDRRLAWAAADLTAETFARAWLWRRRFDDRRDGTALPWLYGIAANVLRETVRRDRVDTRARERLGLPTDLGAEDFAAVDQRLSPRETLARALAALPEDQRRAVQLRVLQDLSYREVAKRLSIRPAAARLRVSRALRRLAVETKEEL
jgi:RNA polymerase sigma factor (sigma-70 family)